VHMNNEPPIPPPGVRRVLLQCLDDVDAIVDRWLQQVRSIPPYGAGRVDEEDLRNTARQVLGLLLRYVAGMPVADELAAVSRRVGERRAQQGVPLDSLLDAARLDFRVLWDALISRTPERDMADLAGAAHRVWEVVERHVTGIMASYQRTVLEMGRLRQDERRAWFARLLDNNGRNPDVVRDAGRVLGFTPTARFIAVVADPDSGAALRQAAAALSAAGIRCHRHEAPTGDILVAQLPTRSADPEGAVLRELAGVACGVSPVVTGLARVPKAVRLAAATTRTLGTGGPAGPRRLEDAWLEVLAAHTPEIAAELAERVLAPLERIPLAEAERLIATVHVHVSGSGSIGDTAAALYCHRNTVQYRFGRFRELTGRDVRVPQDAAVVALALRAAALGFGEFTGPFAEMVRGAVTGGAAGPAPPAERPRWVSPPGAPRRVAAPRSTGHAAARPDGQRLLDPQGTPRA